MWTPQGTSVKSRTFGTDSTDEIMDDIIDQTTAIQYIV